MISCSTVYQYIWNVVGPKWPNRWFVHAPVSLSTRKWSLKLGMRTKFDKKMDFGNLTSMWFGFRSNNYDITGECHINTPETHHQFQWSLLILTLLYLVAVLLANIAWNRIEYVLIWQVKFWFTHRLFLYTGTRRSREKI